MGVGRRQCSEGSGSWARIKGLPCYLWSSVSTCGGCSPAALLRPCFSEARLFRPKEDQCPHWKAPISIREIVPKVLPGLATEPHRRGNNHSWLQVPCLPREVGLGDAGSKHPQSAPR